MKSELLASKCPRKCTRYITEPCPVAVRTLELSRHQSGTSEQDGSCPWAVHSIDSHFCFWNLLWREAPVEDMRELAGLLGISTSDADAALNSALTKLRNLAESTDEIEALWALVEQHIKPLDNSVYLQLLDVDDFDPNQDEVAGYSQQVGGEVPDPQKRDSTLKHETTGFSGAAAVHKSGNKSQLFGLSANWWQNAKEFEKNGTPIVLAPYSLKKRKKKGDQDDQD
jgi:hypothetical protein